MNPWFSVVQTVRRDILVCRHMRFWLLIFVVLQKNTDNTTLVLIKFILSFHSFHTWTSTIEMVSKQSNKKCLNYHNVSFLFLSLIFFIGETYFLPSLLDVRKKIVFLFIILTFELLFSISLMVLSLSGFFLLLEQNWNVFGSYLIKFWSNKL